ncbi:hypothetical protein AB1283_00920 [Bacillus sp. S13(2024)]|uniref:hypothetical protein n=1 Tax=Bacillus sp. S13(2024) TaxID=3162885 RepID=UPI003D23DFF4
MLAAEKIELAIKHLTMAKESLEQGNKRIAIGETDRAKDLIPGIIYTLISQVEEEEGKF